VLPFLHLIDQTRALWRTKDYSALEMRFRLAAAEPLLSVESRRAGCLLVDAAVWGAIHREAADTNLPVQAEHDRVGDLGSWINRIGRFLDVLLPIQRVDQKAAARRDSTLKEGFRRRASRNRISNAE